MFITLQIFLATRTVCQRTNIRAHFWAGQMEVIMLIAFQIFLTIRTILNLGNHLLGKCKHIYLFSTAGIAK